MLLAFQFLQRDLRYLAILINILLCPTGKFFYKEAYPLEVMKLYIHKFANLLQKADI